MQEKSKNKHVLILSSPYYAEITNQLHEGAIQTIKEAGATYETYEVPGALEIPQALAQAIYNGLFGGGEDSDSHFHGVIALGCVIRGETSHYDIVAEQSTETALSLAVSEGIPFGNAILTVENKTQAEKRASVNEKNKGRDAALACLSLIELGDKFYELAKKGENNHG